MIDHRVAFEVKVEPPAERVRVPLGGREVQGINGGPLFFRTLETGFEERLRNDVLDAVSTNRLRRNERHRNTRVDAWNQPVLAGVEVPEDPTLAVVLVVPRDLQSGSCLDTHPV